jgi:MFS family permease
MINPILVVKLGWIKDGTKENKIILMNTSAMIGIALGSILSSKVMSLYGRQRNIRHLVVSLQIAIAAFNIVKMVLNEEAIVVSRFMCGILGGILNTIFSKLITDTIPSEAQQTYGLAQNGSI